MSISRARSWLVAACVVLSWSLLLGRARAQSFSASFPRPQSPNTYTSFTTFCNQGTRVTRTFTTYRFQFTAAGTYTINATRTDGKNGLRFDLYQGAQFVDQAGCPNWWQGNDTAGSSLSTSVVISSALISFGPATFELVIGGADSTDNGAFTLSVSGPASVTTLCDANDWLSPSSQSGISGSGASFSTTYTPATGCSSWTTSGVPSWVTGIPASSSGTQTISYTVAANGGAARSASIGIGNQTLSLSQLAGASCSYSLSPTSAGPSAAGGSSSFNVSTTSGCAWTATSNASWLTGVTASGSGSGSVGYTVAANTGPARTGTITAASRTFTVNQSNGCTASLGTSSTSVGAGGTTSSVALTMSNGSCPWTATSNASWITGVTASGTGSSSVAFTVAANTGAARSGTLTIVGQTYTVNQSSGCSVSVSPTSGTVGAAAGSSSFSVSTTAGCAWTASTGTSWLSGVTASGTGPGTVSFSYAANTSVARSGSIRATATDTGTFADHTVNQSSGCTASLGTSSTSVGAGSTTSSASLTMSNAACPWTATSNAAWITGVPASGTGSSNVAFTAAANTGPVRSGTVTIGGQTFTVNQSSGCSVSVSPTSGTVAATAGGSSFSVSTTAGCAWTASTGTSWLSGVTASGTGPGTVSFSYATNVGLGRNGSIRATATDTGAFADYTVNQSNGCTATLAVPSTNVGTGGGTGSVALTMSDPACPWTATSNAAWITGVTSSGTGSSTIGFTVAPETGPARSGTLTIAGQTFTVNQASGCALTLVPANTSVSASAGNATFDVQTTAGCGWTTSESLAWVNGTTASGTGSGTIAFNYDANPGVQRSGTIRVTSTDTGTFQDYTVTQGNGCVAMLASSGSNAGASAGAGTISLTMSDAACPWAASSVDAWLAPATTNGTGSATVGYTVAANVGPMRVGTVTVAGLPFLVTQASGCAVSVTPTSGSVGAAAGNTSFDVTTAAGCAWSASSSLSWITGLTASGTGPGTISVTYGANVAPTRSGTVHVSANDTGASADYQITQNDGCTATLAMTSASAAAAGATASVGLSMSDPTCPWTATSNDAWITGVTPSGTGSSTVAFTVAAQTGPARSGTITIATRTFTVNQASGCVVSLTPTSAQVGEAAGTTPFDVLTTPGCPWTTSTPDTWIPTLPASGTGPGTITVGYDANGGVARTGTVTVTADSGGQATFTLGQHDGCVVTLPTRLGDAPASGGSSSFAVAMGQGCGFTATSSSGWVTPRTTQGGVAYDVAGWDGVARDATITVTSTTSPSSATFTVHQASGCMLMLTPGFVNLTSRAASGSFTVTTAAGCAFSASATNSFLTNVVVVGSTVTFDVGSNGGGARMGTIDVTATDSGSVAHFVVQQAAPGVTPGLDGGVTSVVPIGKGCSSAPGTSGVPLYVVLGMIACVVLLARRRRRSSWLVAIVLVIVPTTAEGQGYSLLTFRPASSERVDYLTVESGESRLPGRFEVGGALGYDARPLVGRTANGEIARVVGGQLWLDVRGAFAIGDRFRLAAYLPFVLERSATPSLLGLGFEHVDRGSVGDISLVPKVSLITRTPTDGSAFARGFALAVLVPVTLPTGSEPRLSGEGVTAEPRVAADYSTESGLGAGFSVGYRIRPERIVLGAELDDQLTLGVATRLPILPEKLFAIAEVVSDLALTSNQVRNASRGEALASLRFMRGAIVATAGVGAGFLGGVAAPRFRAFASLSYAPRPSRAPATENAAPLAIDTDGDGLADDRDRCPTDPAETADGCPAEPAPVPEPAPQPSAEEMAEVEETASPEDAPISSNPCEANPDAPECHVPRGCASATATRVSEGEGLPSFAYFEFGSTELTPEGEQALRQAADRITVHPELGRILVLGHTDSTGTESVNRALADARAEAAIRALVRAGVPRSRLHGRGVGSRCALPPTDSSGNRRIELIVESP